MGAARPAWHVSTRTIRSFSSAAGARAGRLLPESVRAIPWRDGVSGGRSGSGEPQRIDRYEGRGGQVIERFVSFGYGSATAAPVKLGGVVWGALVAAGPRGAPFQVGSERRLTDFAELVAQALANAEAYTKLAASRARIVEAADTERRRLERNLHDGAQQRLVSLALKLRLIKAALQRDPERPRKRSSAQARPSSRKRLTSSASSRAASTRQSSRPWAWAPRFTRSSTARPSLSRSRDYLTSRLPDPIEAAIYYLVAEAITNVAKYAHATEASVAVDDRTASPLSSSATTASVAPDPARAQDWSASPTASRRSAADYISTARRSGHPPLRRDSLRLRGAARTPALARATPPRQIDEGGAPDRHAPSVRFRRSIEGRNVFLAETAALEMGSLSLEDALKLVVLYAEAEDDKFDTAALRWLGRLLLERPLTLAVVALSAELVSQLRGPGAGWSTGALETLARE